MYGHRHPPKTGPAGRNQGGCLWPYMEGPRHEFGWWRQLHIHFDATEGRNRERRECHAPSTRSHRFRPFRKPELQYRRFAEAWVVGGAKSESAMATAEGYAWKL